MTAGLAGLLAAALLVLSVPSALAAGDHSNPVPVALDEVRTLRVTTLGQVLYDGPGRPPTLRGDCSRISTHTDAGFGGGTYVAQAGFAEDEIAAASYVLAPSDFPIKLEMAEMLFVTSDATEQTVTQWSLLVWEGTPATGSLTYVIKSDDVTLPHIRLGPGTAATDVQLTVDPSDPEQLYLYDNGSHTFSIGYRIDLHNSQTVDPCLTGPPTCCNAFPTTDVGGLASLTGNWLDGLNCGFLGCPPFGGWATFGDLLPLLCRPTGDWVMRATWSSVNCTPGVGACCATDGSCSVLTTTECQNQSGTFQGDGTTCQPNPCPEPTGACCFQATGGCLLLSASNCALAGGYFQGGGTTCGSIICFPKGACCLPDGSCQDNKSPEACTGLGGTFQGNASQCASVTCPPPVGGCCFSTGYCLDLTQADCQLGGGSWAGFGTACGGPPLIVGQPVGQDACAGRRVTFAVAACGNPLPTYQWRKGGADLLGATETSYTIDPVSAPDAGSYDVLVTNAHGSTPSAPAALTVTIRCDANCDGVVDFDDISAFVRALASGEAVWRRYYNCDYTCANDSNQDGQVDFDDINAFVKCLLNP